ncbi:MAG TPA: hypothetical protein PKU75_12680, partial [Tetrasphaera australiensis]|nr:hypothetical protein [Tetrasphaera australiensis]
MSVIELPRSTAREREHQQWWEDATVIAGELNHWHAQLVDLTARVIAADAWGAHGGIRSPAHWLALRAGLSPATAAHIVTLAQARARMPIVTGLFE